MNTYLPYEYLHSEGQPCTQTQLSIPTSIRGKYGLVILGGEAIDLCCLKSCGIS